MEDQMDEVTAIELQIEDERAEDAAFADRDAAFTERQTRINAGEHFDGDDCDLSDPHEEHHHAGGSGYCSHPECRADDLNDDAKVGF